MDTYLLFILQHTTLRPKYTPRLHPSFRTATVCLIWGLDLCFGLCDNPLN
jgi:hypothetical protein